MFSEASRELAQQRVLAELREATIERAVHEEPEPIGFIEEDDPSSPYWSEREIAAMKKQPKRPLIINKIRPSQQPINRMTAALIGWAAVIIALAVVAIPMLLSRYG